MNCSLHTPASQRWYFSLPVIALFSVANFAAAADDTDVTKVVAAAVKDNKLSISADNETFGDTAPGIPKSLKVEYRVNDEKLKKEVGEGRQLEIATPAGAKLVILKAIYGRLGDASRRR